MQTLVLALFLLLVFTWNFLEGWGGQGPFPIEKPYLRSILSFIIFAAYCTLGFFLLMDTTSKPVDSIWDPLLTILSFSAWVFMGVMLYILVDSKLKK
jgi:hypothetical protein